MKSILLLTRAGTLLTDKSELLIESFLKEQNKSARYTILNNLSINMMSVLAEQYDPSILTPSPNQPLYDSFSDAFDKAKNGGAPLNALLLFTKLNEIIEKQLPLDSESLITCIALVDSFTVNNEREFKVISLLNYKIKLNDDEYSFTDDKLDDSLKLFFILSGIIKIMMLDLAKPVFNMVDKKSFSTKF